MGKDFPIRIDLMRMGIPERTIRVLEKAALIVQTIERVTGTETSLDTVDGQIEVLDADLTTTAALAVSNEGRLDDLEAGNGPYVELSGDTMTGALDVQDEVRCDSFRLDQAAAAGTITPTHTFTISLNGTNYKVAVQAA